MSSAMHGAAASKYKCSPTDEICKIPVGNKFSADDCILFLWATLPKLEEAFKVGHAWGFTYVTSIPWFKTIPGTKELALGVGFWAQGNAELLMVWRKGKPKRKKDAPHVLGYTYDSEHGRVLYAPRKKHSQKPMLVYEYIERTVEGPYLELYARNPRAGWTSWGNELGFMLGPKGVSECIIPAPPREGFGVG
jgi:N6-adenosine-specific RNA methylase IME4